MNSDVQKLKNITEEFVSYILGDLISDKMCFTVCYPLSLYLTNNGYENIIKSGWYNSIPHYVISLKNSDEIIIDPTIQQFDIIEPQVLITSLQVAEEYKDFGEIIFKDVLSEWLYPLMNNGSRKLLPRELLANLTPQVKKKYLTPIDIIPLLTISDRAARILQKDTNQSLEIKEYLEIVKTISNRNLSK